MKPTIRVDLTSQLERVRVRDIGVGSGDGQDDGGGLGDVGADHGTNLLLDIGRLVADGYTRHTREIDERQIEHVGREDTQTNRLRRHSLVAASGAVGLGIDLLADAVKVVEALVGLVQELSPLDHFRCCCCCCCSMDFKWVESRRE